MVTVQVFRLTGRQYEGRGGLESREKRQKIVLFWAGLCGWPVQSRGVEKSQVIQGRSIGPVELEQVRRLLAAHPEWSRYRLSRELCQVWDWRNLTWPNQGHGGPHVAAQVGTAGVGDAAGAPLAFA